MWVSGLFQGTGNTEIGESDIDSGTWPRKYIIYARFLLTGPFTNLQPLPLAFWEVDGKIFPLGHCLVSLTIKLRETAG